MAARGIEIALIDARGNVFDVRPETEEGCRWAGRLES